MYLLKLKIINHTRKKVEILMLQNLPKIIEKLKKIEKIKKSLEIFINGFEIFIKIKSYFYKLRNLLILLEKKIFKKASFLMYKIHYHSNNGF